MSIVFPGKGSPSDVLRDVDDGDKSEGDERIGFVVWPGAGIGLLEDCVDDDDDGEENGEREFGDEDEMERGDEEDNEDLGKRLEGENGVEEEENESGFEGGNGYEDGEE